LLNWLWGACGERQWLHNLFSQFYSSTVLAANWLSWREIDKHQMLDTWHNSQPDWSRGSILGQRLQKWRRKRTPDTHTYTYIYIDKQNIDVHKRCTRVHAHTPKQTTLKHTHKHTHTHARGPGFALSLPFPTGTATTTRQPPLHQQHKITLPRTAHNLCEHRGGGGGDAIEIAFTVDFSHIYGTAELSARVWGGL